LTARQRRFSPALLFLVTVGVVVVTLGAAEAVLRLLGQRPGVLSAARFQRTDDLRLVGGLIADDEGVMKGDPALREEIQELIADEESADRLGRVRALPYELSIRDMIVGFARIDPSFDHDNAFDAMIDELESRDDDDLTDLEEAYLDYSRLPLNNDGFRSIEFEDFGGDAKKVLLLGDSFTWGFSARPLTASFADNLAAAGYAVYNTGITAVGPAQYEHLAKKYIEELEPDFVIVNFYLANDIVWWERELVPHQFPHYPTNVGFFWAEPRGEYFDDFRDAYEYTLQGYFIPDQELKPFNRLCARTVIGTKLWVVLSKMGLVALRSDRFAVYDERNAGVSSDEPLSELHIERIRDAAQAAGSAFLLSVILDLPETVSHDYGPDDVFNRLPYHVSDLTLEDYHPAPDAHFNNQGHRRYADFLIGLMSRDGADEK